MKYRSLLLAIFACSAMVTAAESFTLKSKIQPTLSVEQKGSTSDSGDYSLGFNRLKLYTEYKKSLKNSVSLSGDLALDFSKKEIAEIVKKAQVEVEFRPEIALAVGQYKVPFLRNDYMGSGSLPHIHRSFTSNHLRDELAITGYKQGVSVRGSFLEEKLSYRAGLFYDETMDLKGFDGGELVMLPSVLLSYSPVPSLEIRYGGLFPEFCSELIDNTIKKKRLALHSFSVSYEAPKLYETALDLFIGVDTAEGRELMQMRAGYTENTSLSIYTNHTFKVPVKEKSQLLFSVAGEFLNGLTYYDDLYNDRAYTYALFGSAAFVLRKNFRVDLTLDERFDKDFKAIKEKRAVLQCTFSPTLLSRSK